MSSSPPRPWIRWFARAADSILAVVFLILLIAVSGSAAQGLQGYVLGLGSMLLWLVCEAALLSSFGTTPGKWIGNIHLTDTTGARLDFGTALRRGLLMLLFGLGLGVPVVSFITQVLAYIRLRTTGRTSWDEKTHVVVRHGELGPGRIVLIVLAVVIPLSVLTFAVLVQLLVLDRRQGIEL